MRFLRFSEAEMSDPIMRVHVLAVVIGQHFVKITWLWPDKRYTKQRFIWPEPQVRFGAVTRH